MCVCLMKYYTKNIFVSLYYTCAFIALFSASVLLMFTGLFVTYKINKLITN